MTSLQSDLTHKQPEHDAIANDLSAWLSHGGVIEKLGNTERPQSGLYKYNDQSVMEKK